MSSRSMTSNSDEWVIELPNLWVESPKERLDRIKSAKPRKRELFTIFRVPPHLREGNESAYEPRIVSFGPYHRGNKKLEDMEMRKSHYLQKFLTRNPSKTLDDYLIEMEKMEKQVRGCYSDKIQMTTEQFTGMMLLDGCFIIEFLICKVKEVDGNPLQRMDWVLPVVAYDMLLLENQLPFFVLQTLFNLANIQLPNQQTLVNLMIEFTGELNLSKEMLLHVKRHVPEWQTVYHSLHLFHKCVLLSSKQHTHGHEPRLQKRKPLLHLFRRRCFCLCSEEDAQASESTSADKSIPDQNPRFQRKPKRMPRIIPSAVHLHEAGIEFRKKREGDGGIMDVSFESGVLKMTPFEIYSGTNSLMQNLIAFEQCHLSSKRVVTSFAMFMDCLVDKPADVTILQQAGVLENSLGSEEAACSIFNNLCKEVGNAVEHEYKEMFSNVKNHYDSSWAKWRAKLMRDYFGNPWAFLSLMAAIILLVLTITQTVYAILPYYHGAN